jgi:pimeloyl-ACP methyl ester carboxylesterase
MLPVRALRTVAAVAAVFLLGGCTGLLAAPDDSSPVNIVFYHVPVTGALKPYYAQKPTWTPCSHGMTCTTVKVPLDWTDITRKSISIALVKHAASGRRIGSLLVNPGGPGGSGVDFVENDLSDVVDRNVQRSYDIVGFDPRGVGASEGVKCFTDSQMDDYLYSVDPGAIGSKRWIAAQEKKAKELAASCEKNTGSLLAYLDTVDAAQDMDIIRAALGEAKLNYLGYSYGSYLGTVYAGLHPTLVGRTVFDGVLDPWTGDTGFGNFNEPDSATAQYDLSGDGAVLQAKGFDDELTTYLTGCLTGSTATVGRENCPFSTDVRAARLKVISLLSGLDRNPILAKGGRKLGSATLALAIETSLYNRDEWPTLTRMFGEIEKGNATTAFELADLYNNRKPNGSYSDDTDFANLAIGCIGNGPRVDLNFDGQQARALRVAAPVLGQYEAYGDLVCSGWKYGPLGNLDPIIARGSGPILLVGTTGDPATPYSEAQALAQQLDNAQLVTYNGDGHTAYDKGDGCIDAAVDAYLIDGTVPKTDPECN